ncbi:hypothetical protein BGZ46_006548 [Entomortierella lignicola]|nr:hypothetical protein BGZ46_006548 [Entomortierella lignicola]
MILQAAYLFQVRPQRGCRGSDLLPTALAPEKEVRSSEELNSISSLQSQPYDIHSCYKDRQLKDTIARLTTLLSHPDFQPRLLRSSYSFRGCGHDNDQENQGRPSSRYTEKKAKRTKRIRRDLQDYPIFLTGNPPDLVRLAIEFGHVPFIDHLLYRGFRPRDLPEYFALIPFLHPVPESDQNRNELKRHQSKYASLLERSSELNQIWECMRVANQDLIEACSNADLDGVLNVLDATLVRPRPRLDIMNLQQPESRPLHTPQNEQNVTTNNKGKERQTSYDERNAQYDSTGSEVIDQTFEDDMSFASGVGAGDGAGVGSSSHRGSAAHLKNRANIVGNDQTPEDTFFQGVSNPRLLKISNPALRRTNIFQPRQRLDSEGSQTHYHSLFWTSRSFQEPETSDSQPHMPWVDGRALTSALLAICFRRDGYESELAEALEESKAVPIVSEILKYDSMLTAQSLGQAVLAVAYSRSPGSIRRAYERKLKYWDMQQKQDQNPAPLSSSSESSSSQDAATTAESSNSIVDTSVMDLLMQRIGPREWLKLIKCYLQRQEFEDLAIVLELCPFKGQQLEPKDKSVDREHRFLGRLGPGNELNRRRQQARELICHEAGICGVGSRLSQFNGRGIGQSSYNVSSTLHESSRILFTGSGTRFTDSFMLPRGGFRGIGGNTSAHSSLVANSTQSVVTEESVIEVEEDNTQSTSAFETSHHTDLPQNPWQPRADNNDFIERGEGIIYGDNDDDLNQEQLSIQDSNLAFGGIGSSTTSSSRPGPGIVGIAIQVHAPEHIMNSLLKMGFRFFSICDLSVSDNHPLALQFRQQEKLNRLLIEFCMAPNPETLPGAGASQYTGNNTDKKGKPRESRKRRREEHRYDTSDLEYYAHAIEKFLYPAANHPARGAASIPALPFADSSDERGIQTSTSSKNSSLLPTISSNEIAATQVQSSTLSPSNRLQFVLPPIHLGESFESITSATDISKEGEPSNQSPEILSPITFGQTQYQRSGMAKSMPLPIMSSMVKASDSNDLKFTMSKEGTSYQNMLNETIRCRVREHLSSEYIDLMTVGICLYQACFHQKEQVLSILLEHRLLIAQDALSGAVQVAASVGWRRGLEILLLEHGDMEAEIDAIVTTTSDHVHNSTSVKWDHATAEQLNPVKSKFNRDTSSNPPRQTRSTTAGGLEEFVNHGVRRHRSDGGRLNQSSGFSSGNPGDPGLGGGLRRSSSQSFEATTRPSLDFAHFRAPEATIPPPPPALTPPVLGPITPTTRSSSLRTRLSLLLPNLHSSTNSSGGLTQRKKQKTKQQRQHDQCSGGHVTSDSTNQGPQVKKSRPSPIFLSTTGLYSLPSVMMQRKSRNAVIALMAATTRNDPALVHWLIETFADIKIVHIMQALMIACDRGFIQVLQALVGNLGDARIEGRDPLRLLFRQWLSLQYKKIMETTLLESTASTHFNSKNISEKDSDLAKLRFDSFPFIFLMESSPIFRYYYQTLNTLSSSTFMLQRSRNRKSQAGTQFQESVGINNSSVEPFYNIQVANSSGLLATSSPLRLHRRQQQQQQPTDSNSKPLSQPQQPYSRPRSPQEIKQEIIRILLQPLLETFGSISFRKALDKIPKDCWWPLDHDVRLMVDQEARKSMVSIIKTMKQQKKAQRVQQRQQHQREQIERQQLQERKQQAQPLDKDQRVISNGQQSKFGMKGATKTEQRRSEKWCSVRRWATFRSKTGPKTGESITVSCEEKAKHVETIASAKSFLKRLSFANPSA